MGIFDGMKNIAIETFVKSYVEKYGDLKDINLDSKNKIISVNIQLKGEHDILTVILKDYQIIEESNKTYVKVRSAEASKIWLNNAFQDFLVGKKFEIPEQYSGIIKKFI